MTVVENLRLGHWSRRHERARYEERLERMFELFPRLRERASQAAGTMSGGEQQMLVVARALMSEPKLLLIDELSLGLAPIVVQQLFEAVAEVNRAGTAVLLVEQFVHLALQHSTRAYVLSKGEVAVEGPSKELLSSPELMSAYLGYASVETAPVGAG
jgi:branched-chain amino acid transport system ATP-binding protein